MKNFRYPTTSKIKSYLKLKTLLWFLPIATAGIIGLFYRDLPEKIPLFYSLPWGNDQLTLKIWLFLVPVVMLSINIVNFLIATLFRQKTENYLPAILIVSSFVCNVLAIITIVQIILIVS